MSRGSRSRPRLRHLEDLFQAGAVGDLSDGELVDRFAHGRDGAGESAFAALVERHGPMVFRVCMQTLDDPHAAEDAVQATFLVLARQAGAIRNRRSVSSWLFGVARRASARIRMEEARRRRFESRAAARASASAPEGAGPGPYPELHAEIDRLPEKYRLPIVLCYFEGLTHDQAASRLGWPVGTVKTRLSRGRERLRSRLERSEWPALPPIPAAVPERLVDTITRAACRYARRGIPRGLAPTTVIEVTREVMRTMLLNRLKSAVAIPALFLLGLGALVAAQQTTGKGRATRPVAVGAAAADARSTLRLSGTTDYDPAMLTHVQAPFDCRVDRILVDLGSVVKEGDPLLEVSSADLAAAEGDYELAVSQYVRDKKTYDYKKPLGESNTLPRKELIEVENDLEQSRLKMKLARDRLLLYGLTEREIDAAKDEDGVRKARMTLRSRADGIVVKRGAVQGNHYNSKDTLMALARLDHLRVIAPLRWEDLPRVAVGQELTVIFPFGSAGGMKARVESIDTPEDPRASSARVRTTIPNPDRRYKAGISVRLDLDAAARPDAIEDRRGAGEASPDATTADRLGALERKVDRLLGEAEERTSHAKLLERLDALERKVDRLLERR